MKREDRSLEHQTFPDESFDVVLSLDVLEHVFDPTQACREIARALSPGGHHIFTTPTHAHPGTIKRVIRTPEGIQHVYPPPAYSDANQPAIPMHSSR